MRLKGILFDLDGTLLDTSEGIIESVRHTISSLGLHELTSEVLKTFVGPPVQDSFKKFFGMDEAKAQEAADVFRSYYKDTALFLAKPYPGIHALLEQLVKNNLLIGVATYKREDYAKTLLEHFDIASFCDAICGADNENRLTKTNIILKCLRDLSLQTKDTVLIGDTIHDARGASNAGIPFIGVAYGFGFGSRNDSIPYPCLRCVETVEELADAIFAGNK